MFASVSLAVLGETSTNTSADQDEYRNADGELLMAFLTTVPPVATG